MKFGAIFLLSSLSLLTHSCRAQNPDYSFRTVTGDLDTPWEILWGPDQNIWFSERMGRISKVDPETGTMTVLGTLNNVREISESGLLGIALHPDYPDSAFLYTVYTYLSPTSTLFERLSRFPILANTLGPERVLLDSLTAAGNHNGSRLLFLPDKTLLMTTGDAQQTSLSQNMASRNGKILRLNPDGTRPTDNPHTNLVWSHGHRNPQGLCLGPQNQVWSSEHGPQNDDEINRIQKGRNYGWPQVEGFCDQPNETQFCTDSNVAEPAWAWTPTLAVCGLDYYPDGPFKEWKNSLLMTNLKASSLTVMHLNASGEKVDSVRHFFNAQLGRLRDVCVSPDGRIFLATSNKDGRGQPRTGDDRIVEIVRTSGTGSGAKPGAPGLRQQDRALILEYPAQWVGSRVRVYDLSSRLLAQARLGNEGSFDPNVFSPNGFLVVNGPNGVWASRF